MTIKEKRMNLIDKYRQQKNSTRYFSKITNNVFFNVTKIEGEDGMYVGTGAFDGEQYRIPGNHLVRMVS